MTAEIAFVSAADGVRVAVHDHGGAGPPLLLAHAAGFHGRVWEPLCAALTERFHCLALDHRAHGDSGPPPADDLDWRGFGDDVVAVVDGLGLRRPAGVGHSAGATALLLAEQARPGTFASLYCFEPVIVPADPPLGPDPDSWAAAAARRRRETFGSREEAFATYRTKPPLSSLAPAVLRAYVEHGFREEGDGTVRLKCRREHEARIAELATAHDAFVRLPDVACEVVLACGTGEDAFGPRPMRAGAARLRRARIEVLAGLGHLGPLQDPEAVAASVLRCVGDGRA